MNRSRMVVVLTVAALMINACAIFAAPVAQQSRTPLPTWTLPFASPTPKPTKTPTPAAVVAVVVPPTSAQTEPPTPAMTATNTAVVGTDTPVPSPSPTARPGIDPTLGPSRPDALATHELPIPEPMPQLRFDQGVYNILLLGRDTERASRSYRTDVMIVVSINKDAGSVTMLTIPRDLYVYIPGWTMNRINTAAARGDAIGYPGGGVALLEQTILYNLGIPIHGWARVDFQGFKDVVNVIGGVEVPVSCAMQDWRLKDPALDQQNADNWELYTVETGVQHMDGDMALWYARSRKRSSDFDRSRRQHQVLRAIFDKALRLQMLTKAPELYAEYIEIVDTDLGLGDLLQFVPMATQLDRSHIKSRFISREYVSSFTTSTGAAVLLPNREAISALLAEAFLPPPQNVLARAATAVEVWNGTAHADWAALAADNLAWAGLAPVIGQADTTSQATTVIYDFTTSAKGSQLKTLQHIFQVADENVIAAPDANAAYPFRVVLGADFKSCVRPQPIIRITSTPVPEASPEYVQGESIIHAAAVLEPPPGIDGDLAEWTHLVYGLSEPLFNPEEWYGPDDSSAAWNIAWDEEYLYIALNIKDESFVQLASGSDLYKGDGLELWFDADLAADPSNRTLTGDDFLIGLSPGNLSSPHGVAEAYLAQPGAEARLLPEVFVVGQLLNGSYALEIAVPWKVLRVTPIAGRTYGLALGLNDDDTPGSAELQSQLTNRPGQKRHDPTTWGILVLDYPPAP